jgi:DNA-binding transcriptional LysR family regulator
MELRHLRYYVAVAEELSFGRAASRLAIAQPPLSRQIQALEDEVGVRLLVRTKRRVLLTEAGRSFLEGARATLSQATRAIDQARRANRGENGTLSVAVTPSAELVVMHAVVRAVARANRDLRMDVHACAEHEALRAVQGGSLQVAILPTPAGSAERDVHLEPLASRRLRVVLPATHALARRSRLKVRQLADDPIVLFTRAVSPAIHDAVVAAFQGEGVPLHVRHEASHLHTCLELVAAGAGITFMPAAPGRQAIVFRPLEPASVALDFAVAYRDDLATDGLRDFVRLARSALRAPE